MCLSEIRGLPLPLFAYGLRKDFGAGNVPAKAIETGQAAMFGCCGPLVGIETLKELGTDAQDGGAVFSLHDLPRTGQLTVAADRKVVQRVEEMVRAVYVTFAVRRECRRLVKSAEEAAKLAAQRARASKAGTLANLMTKSAVQKSDHGRNVNRLSSTLRKSLRIASPNSQQRLSVDLRRKASFFGQPSRQAAGEKSSPDSKPSGGGWRVAHNEHTDTEVTRTDEAIIGAGSNMAQQKARAKRIRAPEELAEQGIYMNGKQIQDSDVLLVAALFENIVITEGIHEKLVDFGQIERFDTSEVKVKPFLSVLSFRDNLLTAKGAQNMVRVLINVPLGANLQILDFSGNIDFGDEGVRVLMTAIDWKTCTIAELMLGCTGMTNGGATELSTWLPSVKTLEFVDLSQNGLGDEFGRAHVEYYGKRNKVISELGYKGGKGSQVQSDFSDEAETVGTCHLLTDKGRMSDQMWREVSSSFKSFLSSDERLHLEMTTAAANAERARTNRASNRNLVGQVGWTTSGRILSRIGRTSSPRNRSDRGGSSGGSLSFIARRRWGVNE